MGDPQCYYKFKVRLLENRSKTNFKQYLKRKESSDIHQFTTIENIYSIPPVSIHESYKILAFSTASGSPDFAGASNRTVTKWYKNCKRRKTISKLIQKNV